jgi:hypothetical protein
MLRQLRDFIRASDLYLSDCSGVEPVASLRNGSWTIDGQPCPCMHLHWRAQMPIMFRRKPLAVFDGSTDGALLIRMWPFALVEKLRVADGAGVERSVINTASGPNIWEQPTRIRQLHSMIAQARSVTPVGVVLPLAGEGALKSHWRDAKFDPMSGGHPVYIWHHGEHFAAEQLAEVRVMLVCGHSTPSDGEVSRMATVLGGAPVNSRVANLPEDWERTDGMLVRGQRYGSLTPIADDVHREVSGGGVRIAAYRAQSLEDRADRPLHTVIFSDVAVRDLPVTHVSDRVEFDEASGWRSTVFHWFNTVGFVPLGRDAYFWQAVFNCSANAIEDRSSTPVHFEPGLFSEVRSQRKAKAKMKAREEPVKYPAVAIKIGDGEFSGVCMYSTTFGILTDLGHEPRHLTAKERRDRLRNWSPATA